MQARRFFEQVDALDLPEIVDGLDAEALVDRECAHVAGIGELRAAELDVALGTLGERERDTPTVEPLPGWQAERAAQRPMGHETHCRVEVVDEVQDALRGGNEPGVERARRLF